jgi:hypothetical protein
VFVQKTEGIEVKDRNSNLPLLFAVALATALGISAGLPMISQKNGMGLERENEMERARSWADRTIGNRLHLNEDRRYYVYKVIAILDSHYLDPRQ